MSVTSERTALYRLLDAQGCLLYVGIGFDPVTRWRAHAAEKPWWPLVADKRVTWFQTRDEAERAEETAILAESPIFNVVQHRQRYRPNRGTGKLLPAVAVAADTYRHAVAVHEAASQKLAMAMRDAHRDQMQQSAILRASKHVWTREYLRIVLGLNKKRTKCE